MIYVNKIENRITFKVKKEWYPGLLTPEKKQLLGSTKTKITKDENSENMAHLEITEVALVLAILLTTVMKRIQESFIHLFLINHLVNY